MWPVNDCSKGVKEECGGRQGSKIVVCVWGWSVGVHHLFECEKVEVLPPPSTPPLTSPFPKARCHISSPIKTLNYMLLSREGGLVVAGQIGGSLGGGERRRGGVERRGQAVLLFKTEGLCFGNKYIE